MKFVRLGVIISLAVLATSAHSTSFDCQKAQSYREITVCSDTELANLDDQLNAVYLEKVGQAKASGSDVTLRQSQRDWIKSANNCADSACLSQVYQDRISQLDSLTFETPASKSPEPVTASKVQPEPQKPIESSLPSIPDDILSNQAFLIGAGIYVVLSGLLALTFVRPWMIKWYKNQVFMVNVRNAEEAFIGHLGRRLFFELFIFAVACVLGSVGGNIIGFFKLFRK